MQISDALTIIGWIAGIASIVVTVIVYLLIHIFGEFKKYCAERFEKHDSALKEHKNDNERTAEHNTAEHAKLHSRIDDHISDHLQGK